MANTVTTQCNLALSHIGTRSKVTSIGEDSPEARTLSTHFEATRDELLRRADWNFARYTVSTLTSVTPDEPISRWLSTFSVPGDCIRIRRLNDVPVLQLPETFYEVALVKVSTTQTNAIMANCTSLAAIYTAQITNLSLWDPGFVIAHSFLLASRINFELTGKDDRTRTLLQQSEKAFLDAAAEMANEQSPPNRTYMPETLASRGFSDGLSVIGQVWPGGPFPWWPERPSS